MTVRLKAKIWVDALLRRAQIAGASAYIIHKGDPDAGVPYVKVSTLDGQARLYSPARDLEGRLNFSQTQTLPEKDIDTRILKTREFDRDLWLIEIEDKAGRSFLVEDVIPINM